MNKYLGTFGKNIHIVKQGGFTIVELLIVIVIIGILAALVIVAYTGITARANSTKAKTNATAIQKKVEAWAADSSAGPSITTVGTSGTGNYPLLVATGVSVMTGSAQLPSGVTVGKADPTALNGTTTVGYKVCTATTGAGYQVLYWDFAASSPAAVVGASGGSQTGCVYPAS